MLFIFHKFLFVISYYKYGDYVFDCKTVSTPFCHTALDVGQD